ncbi:hypothetical protein GGS23DRAFT_585880 [Durotheca rogersii]|uniref:uncharacterized protein n=1 Tax=Durotheca rogersii TaxID=419775 RepID=UPI00222032A8|nr:uncharacterized protein GGS23DRAFT_585880 [Durotheca rogersii]KAI5859325.1 hypothetical protein GGS23DRAFT_585880 [Durotheca rogersii]
MPTLPEAQARGPDEDWSGLKDAKARRRLQTRLNVRAYRRRKASLGREHIRTGHGPPGRLHGPYQPENRHEQHRANSPVAASSGPLLAVHPRNTDGDRLHSFPLSLDHLIPLVQYNFIRGVLTNVAILGSQNAFPPPCSRRWANVPLFPAPSTIPESLEPTALQLSTPHEPWMDLIPDKQMRDNAILMMGVFQREDVEEDVTRSLYENVQPLEFNGVLVWNQPWRPEGWELTEGFIKRWPFLVKGCWAMLESTNRWRALRGEDPLVVEL